LFATILIIQNFTFIKMLTTDPTGLETIAAAQNAPPDSTLMIAWGPRHFAVGFARDVWNQIPDIRLVDHKADFTALVREGKLVTPAYTFYNQPVDWWIEQMSADIFLRAAAPNLVEIGVEPVQSDDETTGLAALNATVTCNDDQILLAVDWFASEQPTEDLSVFVHLLDGADSLIAQADQSAPVYGWRPLITWTAGEVIHDIYPLPRLDTGATARYGLYQQRPTGEFENVLENTLPVDCNGE
jgi:hypothetical protein